MPQNASGGMEALVDRFLTACDDPRYRTRKQMWTRHQHLEKVAKAPVHVHLPVNGGYSTVWQEIIAADELIRPEGLARSVELQLRQRLYKHQYVPDDDVILPVIHVGAAYHTPGDRVWGLRLRRREADMSYGAGGSYKPIPPVQSDADLDGLSYPADDIDLEETARRVEQAEELVQGRVPVIVSGDRLGGSPFEVVVHLRGMDNLLFDFVDNPRLVHRLMDFVTTAFEQSLGDADRRRLFDVPVSWLGCRVHYEELGPEVLHASSSIANSWVYISAQSAASISPAMFDEFLQPYHERIARLFTPGRIYFHGCEDLTRKYQVIKKTPGLRRFHCSPWSDFAALAPQIGRDCVIEKHVHPANNILVFSEEQMERELDEAMQVGSDLVVDLNLSDIHTVGHRPERLAQWARVAQKVTERYAR